MIALVLVFVGFILLQKDDLRDRFVRLAGSRDMQRTTVALDEAATRLSRYLFLQTCINTCFGLVIGAGLWLIGVPNAGLWALMSMLLRFVPYVGVPLSFLFPFTLSLAVDPGWTKMVWTMILYGSIEATIGQGVEPFLYGRSMGLSAVAVVVAAVFWTWLWGPMGLLLSTPLTMCFVVFSRHVESLKFLDVMLGDQPALRVEESLYLRMLAEDPDEAADEAEDFLRANSLSAYYDEVAARALMLAQSDVNRGVLDPLRQSRIRDAIKGLVANLAERKDEGARGADLPENWRDAALPPVLCVAGRGPLDEAAALLLVDMLSKYGIAARVVSSDEASAANIRDLSCEGVRLTLRLLSGARHLQECPLPGAPAAQAHARCAGHGPVLGPGGGPFALSRRHRGDGERHRHHRPEGNRAACPGLCPPLRRAPEPRGGDVNAPGDYGVLLTTTPRREEAANIAKLLIDEKLAACVQLLPIESFYAWQGETRNAAEILLLVKTRCALFEKAIARIKAVHSYSVPQIVAIPFTAGFSGYFDWIAGTTAP